LIAHVVLFNEKSELTTEQRQSFAQLFQDTVRAVPSVSRATIGRSVALDPGYAREFGDKTYRFAAVVEFSEKDGLLAYLNHPLHHELGRLFWEYCESTVVLELETIDALSGDVAAIIG